MNVDTYYRDCLVRGQVSLYIDRQKVVNLTLALELGSEGLRGYDT
jgi:hypothetical protein